MSKGSSKRLSDPPENSRSRESLSRAAEVSDREDLPDAKTLNAYAASTAEPRSARMAAHAARIAMLGEISGSIAHELNQPLTAIMINAQSAERMIRAPAIDRAELAAVIADIIHDTTRASEVIRHLRALLKKGNARRTMVDPQHVLNGVLELTHSELVARGIVTEKKFTPLEDRVFGDAVQLEQLFLNIIMNAAEALTRGGTIAVTTECKDPRSFHIQISDNGPGIHDEIMGKLFDSFFTTKPQGLGIGLSLARTIVLAHGGEIWATNNPQGGATFHVTLPIRQEQGKR